MCRVEATCNNSDSSLEASTRFEFQVAQLHHHTLEPDPQVPLNAPAQRERLVFAFSTGDVVVFGVRLAPLLDHLRDQKLAAISPLAERYANLEPSQPCVTGITVRLLPDKSGNSVAG